MRITVDIPDIRVTAGADYKGNDVICLDLLGHYVLYKRPEGPDPEEEAEGLNDWLPGMVARMLGELFLERNPHLAEAGWQRQSPTGREVDYRPAEFSVPPED